MEEANLVKMVYTFPIVFVKYMLNDLNIFNFNQIVGRKGKEGGRYASQVLLFNIFTRDCEQFENANMDVNIILMIKNHNKLLIYIHSGLKQT